MSDMPMPTAEEAAEARDRKLDWNWAKNDNMTPDEALTVFDALTGRARPAETKEPDDVTAERRPLSLLDDDDPTRPVQHTYALPAAVRAALTPKPPLRIVRASTIALSVTDWAWEHGGHGRIPKAALTLFAGRPAAGKSTCARWFAAGWSNGTLEGCWHGQPVNVAYIATEEHWESAVAPSLHAAGADMDRVFFVERGDEPARIKATADENALTEMFAASDIRAVVLDPLMSTLTSGADLYKSNEIREALDPWVRIAEKIGGVVLGVTHLVKTAASGDVVAAINGSSAFGEVARSVFGFAVDRESDDGTRIMSQGKNSAGRDNLNMTYKIEPVPFTALDGRRGEAPRFVLGEPTDTKVGDLMMAEGKQKRAMSAPQWLEAWFDSHPHTPWMTAAEIVAAGARFGHGEDSLAQARYRKGYLVHKDPLGWSWAKPDAEPFEPSANLSASRDKQGRFTT
ncbi:AAA family ATPase [Mycolicibacterium gilvum]|uniref:AAA family ATPase n=1 Tax=Mycolicibacterium gilvum TaxID=1804 RepID=UPI0040460EB1